MRLTMNDQNLLAAIGEAEMHAAKHAARFGGPSRVLLGRLRDAEKYVENNPLDKCQTREERERLFRHVDAALRLAERVEAMKST